MRKSKKISSSILFALLILSLILFPRPGLAQEAQASQDQESRIQAQEGTRQEAKSSGSQEELGDREQDQGQQGQKEAKESGPVEGKAVQEAKDPSPDQAPVPDLEGKKTQEEAKQDPGQTPGDAEKQDPGQEAQVQSPEPAVDKEKSQENKDQSNKSQTGAKEQAPDQALEDNKIKPTVLEVGDNISDYIGTPVRANSSKEVKVSSYEELAQAIANSNGETTIVITQSFEITATIVISEGKDIILTSGADRTKDNNKVKPLGEDKITMPNETDSVEKRQELVKEAEQKGEKALEDTDLEKNPLPVVDVVIKRANDFKGTLFNIIGKLTLGKDNKDPIFIDGNKEVQTKLKASFADVSGELTMNGGFIANGNNEKAYSAPIYVKDGGSFTMNGGRISSNKNLAYIRKPDGSWEGAYFATGGVYINQGGTFTLNAGSIDNNEAPVGGVFLGEFYNPSKDKDSAKFIMNGGLIARNAMLAHEGQSYIENYGGGVHVNSHAIFTFLNGIIAGNESYRGGGVAVNDNYVTEFNGVSKSETNPQAYEEYIKVAGSYYLQEGGLIYKNRAKISQYPNLTGAGGGLYLNSSTTNFNGGYILKNTSENMGGGIYVSIVPYKLELENTLVTNNNATSGNQYQYSAGHGGGYWNCPVGIVDLQDFHSLYIFDNKAQGIGKDIHTIRKNYYTVNGKYVEFETTISPITKDGNIIGYLVNGKEIPKKIFHTKDGISLQAIYDQMAKEEAWKNSHLFIMGNEALKGGGIGSNAHIIAPGKPGDYEISIEKKWHDSIPENKRPESIFVDVFIGDKKYGEVELSKNNNWIYTFKNLPFTLEELEAKGLKYSIKEQGDDFYSLVEESIIKNLEIKREWLDQNGPYASYDRYNSYMDQEVIFIYKDASGNEVSKESIILEYNDKWSNIIQNKLFDNLDSSKMEIVYHGYKTPYIWDGYYGLHNYSSKYANDEDKHRVYVVDKGNGTVRIELPYLWMQYLSSEGRTDNYSQNTSGYRVDLVDSHAFTITNYPYSEIPIVKKWHESIKDSDIPDSVKVYLLKNGEKVKDKEGNDIFILLTKNNGWQGKFEKLPYFGLAGMEFDRYWVKEESDKFIPLVVEKLSSMLSIAIERGHLKDYPVYEDYTGGTSRVEYIPIELHYNGTVIKTKIENYSEDPNAFLKNLKGFFKDLVIDGNQIEIKTYYDENGNPFRRNLGKYKKSIGQWRYEDVIVEGSYVFKLLEDEGKYALYVPKLTGKETEDNLFTIKTIIGNQQNYFELTNYYLPKHRIEIKKIWEVDNVSKIPESLKIRIKGKNASKEILLTPENWKYFEEFLGKGLLANNSYEFSEEDLENFDGKQSIDISMEFEVKDKEIVFLDDKGSIITKDEFNKLIKGKNYSFELVGFQGDKAQVSIKYDEKGNPVIVYPADVTITELVRVNFTNKELPPEEPETPPKTPPKEPPEEPETPPKTPPEEPEVPPLTPPEKPLLPPQPPLTPPEKPLAPSPNPVAPPKKPQAKRDPRVAPKTFDPGIGSYLGLASLSLLALSVGRKKKEDK